MRQASPGKGRRKRRFGPLAIALLSLSLIFPSVLLSLAPSVLAAPSVPVAFWGVCRDSKGERLEGRQVQVKENNTPNSGYTYTDYRGVYLITYSVANTAPALGTSGVWVRSPRPAEGPTLAGNGTTIPTGPPPGAVRVDLHFLTLDVFPQPPVNLTCTPSGSDLQLDWEHTSSPDLDHYNIYIAPNPFDFDLGTPNATTSGTTWTHVGAADTSINYFYMVRAVDQAGQEEQNEVKVGRYRARLKAGWNLLTPPIDVPFTRASEWAAQIEAGGTSVLEIVDVREGGYVSWISAIPALNDFGLADGRAYFVNAGTVGEWYPNGSLLPNPLSVPLHPGWNAVGAAFHNATTQKATDMLAQMRAQNGAGSVLKVSNWTDEDSWESHDGVVGTDFALDDADHPRYANARGWFVLCTSDGAWLPQ